MRSCSFTRSVLIRVLAAAALTAPISAHALAASVQITVTTPAGIDLLAGPAPSVTCTQETSPYTSVIQPISAGPAGSYVASFTLTANLWYDCLIASAIDGVDTSYVTRVQALAGQSAAGLLALTAFDAQISLSLVTASGGGYAPLPVPAGNPNATAVCYDVDFEHFYTAALSAGDSGAIIKLYGGKNYYCQVSGIDGYGSAAVLFSVDLNQHAAGQIVFVPFDASATIRLVDQNGQPLLAAAATYLYCNTSEVDFGFPATQIHAGEGSGTIALTAGHTYTCNITGIPGYAAAFDTTFFVAPGDGSKQIDLPLAALNEHLTVHLAKPDGAPYVIGAFEWVYVSCQGPYSLFFSQLIDEGSSSVDLSVLHGSYSCWASLAGKAVKAASVTVTQGVAADLVISLIDRDTSVHVHLQDQNGTELSALPGAMMSVWPRDAGISDFTWGPLTGGGADASIVPSVPYLVRAYDVSGVWPLKGSDDHYYLYPNRSFEVQGTSAQVIDLPITVYRADGTVAVSVMAADGSPLPSVGVEAVETPASAGSSAPLISWNFTDSQGNALLPVVAGRSFDVMLLSPDSRLGMAPAPVGVTPAAQEQKSVVLRYSTVDFSLGITATVPGVDHGNFWCYAYDDDGHLATSTFGVPLGQTLTLALLSASTWHVGCSGANESVYFSADEVLFAPTPGQSSGTITISESGGPVLFAASSGPHAASSMSFHVDGQAFSAGYAVAPASAASLTPTAGIQIDMPGGTLDSQLATVTFSAANASGLAANADFTPLTQFAAVLSAHDSGNNAIGVAQGKSLSLSFSVPAAQVTGATAGSLQGARYDGASGVYSLVPTVFDAETSRYTLTVSTLGTYALLKPRAIASDAAPSPSPTPTLPPRPSATPELPALQPPAAEQPPGRPTRLRVEVSKRRATVRWSPPKSGGAVGGYTVSLNRGKRLFKIVSLNADARLAVIKKLSGNSHYTLSVSAINASGSGSPVHTAFDVGR